MLVFSCVQLSATPWTVTHRIPLFTGFCRQELLEWVAIPFSRDLPDPGIEPASPALQADSLPSEPPPACPLFCRASSGLGLVGCYSPTVVARGVLDLTTSTTVTIWLVRTAMTQCQQRCGLHTRSFFLIILEAGCPRLRAQQDRFCKPLSLVCRGPSCCGFLWSALSVCL